MEHNSYQLPHLTMNAINSIVLLLTAVLTTVQCKPTYTFNHRTPVEPHKHALDSPHIYNLMNSTTTATTTTTTATTTTSPIDYTPQALSDEIISLPGLIDTINFKHFSGYLSADTTGNKQIHYWLVLSQSSPGSDPLVWWTNGGPGCSGLIGMFEEHGPWRVQPDSKTVLLNPYSWNRRANVLYFEAPVGVGFSYASDTDHTYMQSGDDNTAIDNYIALQSFFQRFPQFNNNQQKFYLSGESYGGHYVPQLAQQYIQSNHGYKLPNITGLFIGNPILDPVSNQYYGRDQSYWGMGYL